MRLEPIAPDQTSPIIDLTAGFDVGAVDHPYEAAELVSSSPEFAFSRVERQRRSAGPASLRR